MTWTRRGDQREKDKSDGQTRRGAKVERDNTGGVHKEETKERRRKRLTGRPQKTIFIISFKPSLAGTEHRKMGMNFFSLEYPSFFTVKEIKNNKKNKAKYTIDAST